MWCALLDGDPTEFSDRYAVWRDRFNARGDGHAAERLVARILDQGRVEPCGGPVAPGRSRS